ncbi:hypothetical protein chiPu_0030448, partial [Chiloscyllium punctatum]|nr:hypothetical protein [Chiloscyllium punctatum]
NHRRANLIVVDGSGEPFETKVRDRGHEVRARHHPDQAFVAHDRKPRDAVRFHELNDLLKRHVLVDGDRIGRHDLINLAAMLAGEVECDLARACEHGQPAAATLLRSKFDAPNEISVRQHADERAIPIGDGKATDVVGQHRPDGVAHRCIGIDRDDVP